MRISNHPQHHGLHGCQVYFASLSGCCSKFDTNHDVHSRQHYGKGKFLDDGCLLYGILPDMYRLGQYRSGSKVKGD